MYTFFTKHIKAKLQHLGKDYKYLFISLSGATLAQFISLAAAPILSRLYTPEQFGVFAMFMAALKPLAVLVNARYELAVIPAKTDRHANALSSASILVAIIVSILFAIGSFVYVFYGQPSNYSYSFMLLASLTLLGMGFFQPLNNFLIRNEKFTYTATNKIIQYAGIALLAIVLPFMGFKGDGLLVSYSLAWLLVAVVIYRQAKLSGFVFQTAKSVLISISRVYRSYPLYNTIPALLNAFTYALPVYFLSRYYTEDIVGHFNFSRQIIIIPVVFLGSVVSQVALRSIAEDFKNKRPVLPPLLLLVKRIFVPALFVCAVVFLFSTEIFIFLFGNKWELAGNMGRVFIFSAFFQIVTSPFVNAFLSIDKIRVISIWQAVYFVCVLLAAYFSFLNIDVFIHILTLIESVLYVGLSLYFVLYVRRNNI